MRFYIADCHFFHETMLKSFDNRGFESVYDMNEYMIKQWNNRVKKRDEIVVLGDFSMGSVIETNEILSRLNGKMYLVLGNHDKVVNNKEFNKDRFEWIHSYAEMHDHGRKVILSHYPVMCYNGQMRRSNSGKAMTYMLYGHVHSSRDQEFVDRYVMEARNTEHIGFDGNVDGNIPCNMINCFCMYSDYVPLTLDEWIILDENRRRKNYEK